MKIHLMTTALTAVVLLASCNGRDNSTTSASSDTKAIVSTERKIPDGIVPNTWKLNDLEKVK